MSLLNFFNKSKIHQLDEIQISRKNIDNFLNNYYLPRIPVIIKGGAKDWPLIKKWSKNYIIKMYGNYECNIVSDSRPANPQEKNTLKNYFSHYPGKSTLTLEKFNTVNSSFFLKDIKLPNPLFSKKDIARYFFFHSVIDAGTLPHNHRDAFNILKQGKKHWVFYDANKQSAPKGFKELKKCFKAYPSGAHAKEWFNKELKKLPNKVEKVYECFQETSDIVYIPIEYSHAVLNKSEVLGLVIETYRKNK